MSDFETFKSNILDYFVNGTDNTIDKTAKLITSEYVNAVKLGSDSISKNSVVKFNDKILESSLIAAFNVSLNTNTFFSFASISPGLVGFWTGAELTTTGTVPGTISTITSKVTIPGVPVPLQMNPSTNIYTTFLDLLITFFKTHLTTVGGIITGLTPAPPGPPVPVPYPFLGYL